MKDMHVHEEERNGTVKTEETSVDPNPNYQTETVNWVEGVMAQEDREMWFERENEDLLDVNDAFISYGDFPPLPDFPCISSSSSSSSAPLAVANSMKCSASSSSSSSSSSSLVSWAMVKPDAEDGLENLNNHSCNHPQQHLLSTNSMEISMPEINQMDSDCMDVIEELGDMELLDTDDIWDPSSLFPYENNPEEDQQQQKQHDQLLTQGDDCEEQEGKPSEDLAMLFFEWLKSNKESISADDLRSIRLKRSTIECAAKRLGGGKEGMKQLLKLILEWVQNHQLQKKRMREGQEPTTFPYQQQQNPQHSYQNSNPNPNPNPNPDSNPYFIPSTATPWISHPQYISDPMTMSAAYPPMVGYMRDAAGFSNGACATVPINSEYQMMDSTPNWPQSHFSFSTHYSSYPDHHLPPLGQSRTSRAFAAFANQYPCQLFQSHTDQLVRFGSSATKEARKKRMARQRRIFSHHRSQNQQQHQRATTEQHERLGNDPNCTTAHANQTNWVFWPSSSSTVAASTMLMSDAPPHSVDRPPMQPSHYHQRQITLDRRQGYKTGTEKNLKFLLQKVLKQSDVGNLGRIVLPKKEAETYLPELEARDGISIAMEDIGTSRIWNMRYRFWPNNKSRMYLLENTGDFVRSNGLQEGDFIVIYSDTKCNKYLIRGVKVRQPGSKSEAKKQGKVQRKLHATSAAGMGSSSSSIKETVT